MKHSKSMLTRDFGKIIDTTVIDFDGENYCVDIRFSKVGCSSRNYIYSAVYTGAEKDDIIESSKDVTKAIKAVEVELKLRNRITWKTYIHIHVDVDNDGPWNFTEGSGVEVGYSIVQIGTRCDGSKCHREAFYSKEEGVIKHGGGGVDNGWPDDDEGYGLIPFSIQYCNKLDNLILVIKNVRDRVAKLITGEDSDLIVKNLTSKTIFLVEKIGKGEDE